MESDRQIDFDAYLERISVVRGHQYWPSVEGLSLLQARHLLAVPFENLDIHWNRPIVLDVERFFEKIVVSKRGGFCYELNGLFNELLKHLGFVTRLVSARVFNGTVHGPEFDHAAIIVTIDGEEYLADVGFGAFTAEPLKLVMDVEQVDPNGCFLGRHRDDGYFEVLKRDDGIWRSEYIFKGEGHDLADFSEMCDFQQYAPESHFRKGKLCSIMTGVSSNRTTGRKTLTETSFITTENGVKTETPVTSDTQFYETLFREFGIAPSQA